MLKVDLSRLRSSGEVSALSIRAATSVSEAARGLVCRVGGGQSRDRPGSAAGRGPVLGAAGAAAAAAGTEVAEVTVAVQLVAVAAGDALLLVAGSTGLRRSAAASSLSRRSARSSFLTAVGTSKRVSGGR